MKLKKYFKYLKLYNAILNKKTYSRFSIYNLNIIRYHPNYLEFSKKSFKKEDRYSFNTFGKKIDEAEYLFISNLFSKDNQKNYIFKQISKNVDRNKTHFIFRNFSNKKFQFKSAKKTIVNIRPTIISDFIYFLNISLEIIRIFFFNFKLINFQYFKDLLTIKNFKSSISNSYEVDALLSIIKKVKPSKIFISYEGYSWERMLVYQIKKLNSKIKTYGYYFSIISKYQNTPFMKYGDSFDFNFILTSGIPQKNKFLKKGFKKDKIIVVGKEFHKNKKFIKKYANNKNCLILPESFENEIFYMVDFVKDCINQNLDLKFYIKLHPSITNIETIKKIKVYIGNKIRVLKPKDNMNFRYAIFRGSSSIIDYINQGSIPIYLKKKNEPDLSPLYEISKEIKYINNVNDIKKFLKKSNLNHQSKKLKSYSRNYFLELSKSKLINIFK